MSESAVVLFEGNPGKVPLIHEVFDPSVGSFTVLPRPVDPFFERVAQEHQAGHRGEGQVIAVVDSGLVPNHPQIANAVLDARDFGGTGALTDARNGHGTLVGILAMMVAPRARLLNARVLDDEGRCEGRSVVEAVQWAVAQGATVVNLSLGVPCREPRDRHAWKSCELCRGVQTIVEDAQVEVCAALGPSNSACPANAPGVIAVGTDGLDASRLRLPGRAGSTATLRAAYRTAKGTSFAAPLASGFIALRRTASMREAAAEMVPRLSPGSDLAIQLAVLHARACFAFQKKSYEEAESAFIAATAADKGACLAPPSLRTEYGHTLNNYGVLLRVLHRFEEAERMFRSSIETLPQYAHPYHNLGTLRALLGDLDEARELQQRALELQPSYPEAAAALEALMSGARDTLVSVTAKERDAAYLERRQFLPVNPNYLETTAPVDSVIQEAERLRTRGEFGKALELLEKAMETGLAATRVRLARGVARHAMGRVADAIEDYGAVLDAEPDNVAAYYNRANALRGGDSEAALADYAKALSLQPKFTDALHNRAGLLCRLGRLDEARTDLRLALEIHSGGDRTAQRADRRNADAYHQLGILEADAGNHALAIEHLTCAIALQPSDPAPYVRRASCQSDEGRIAEALADLQAALAINPRDPEANFLMAWLLADERPDAALAWVDKALASDPSHVRARILRSHLYLARGNSAEALSDSLAALRVDPDSADAHLNAGVALLQSGAVRESLPHFERATTEGDRLPQSFAMLAQCLMRLGMVDRAREAALACLAHRPPPDVEAFARKFLRELEAGGRGPVR